MRSSNKNQVRAGIGNRGIAAACEYVLMIRRARPDDLTALPEIERAAGEAFREIGMEDIADDDLPTIAELASFQEDGRAWVATDDTDTPVGYVLVEVVDGNAHVEQVSIHPAHARQGLGRRLLDVVERWARDSGYQALTLTTFADVPWNGPYYARLGWRVLDDGELTPELAKVREQEAAHGLDRWPRVAMLRETRSDAGI